MNVSRKSAIAVLGRLNYKTAASWPNDRLASRLQKLPYLVDDVDVITPAKARIYIRKLIDKVLAGDTIDVSDTVEDDRDDAGVEEKSSDENVSDLSEPMQEKKTNKSVRKKKPGFPAKNAKVKLRDRQNYRRTTKRPRMEVSTELIINLREVGHTHTALIEEANRLYMASGGKNNINEAGIAHYRVIQVMSAMGLLEVNASTGVVKPSPNVRLVRR